MSRLHKIGTIYSRVQALIRKGQMSEIEKPVWFDVYTHFPPKYEPTFSRPAQVTEVREIFYQEDKLRAKLHKTYPQLLGPINLERSEETNCQGWMKLCDEYITSGMSESEAVEKLGEHLKRIRPLNTEETMGKKPQATLIDSAVTLD